jgi:hypothetical protein
MNNQNVIIGGLVLAVLYLLKKNKPTTQQANKTVTLENNASAFIDNGDQYKVCYYSSNPIKGELLSNTDLYSMIRLKGNIINQKIISGIPNTI